MIDDLLHIFVHITLDCGTNGVTVYFAHTFIYLYWIWWMIFLISIHVITSIWWMRFVCFRVCAHKIYQYIQSWHSFSLPIGLANLWIACLCFARAFYGKNTLLPTTCQHQQNDFQITLYRLHTALWLDSILYTVFLFFVAGWCPYLAFRFHFSFDVFFFAYFFRKIVCIYFVIPFKTWALLDIVNTYRACKRCWR